MKRLGYFPTPATTINLEKPTKNSSMETYDVILLQFEEDLPDNFEIVQL